MQLAASLLAVATLAVTPLTDGNQRFHYRRMGLHLMPYGINDGKVSVGTLELLGQKALIARPGELNLPDEDIQSQTTWQPTVNAHLEDAIEAVKNPRIIIMNPPFTNRTKMGEKFKTDIQEELRKRTDAMEQNLIANDSKMKGFVDKNSISPLFVAMAESIVDSSDGVTTLIQPTIVLTCPSGLHERRILAKRFHIHTIMTCHMLRNVNMSQNTGINESIIVMCRHPNNESMPHTRFINLNKMPGNDADVDDFHRCLQQTKEGIMPNSWGETSFWPSKRIEDGDWTPAIWRSSKLADFTRQFASNHPKLMRIGDIKDIKVHATSQPLHGYFKKSVHATGSLLRHSFVPSSEAQCSFPILKSKGADGQQTITSTPDAYWIHKEHITDPNKAKAETERLLQKSGHLLITNGQDISTARLTATASDNKYVGNGFLPITGYNATEAKAIAVFLNATPGRLQLMRNAGRTLAFPNYSPAGIANICIPDIKDDRICQTLADCWQQTKDMPVPQFRDGECEVRRLWDEAVASAMGWDADSLSQHRQILHNEPYVRGIMQTQITSHTKTSEKFKTDIQEELRKRTDAMEQSLIATDSKMKGFINKNSIGPMFVALAERIVNPEEGVATFIRPTIAMTNPSGLRERETLAQRFHIHTILTCHMPSNVNMSQNTGINESIIVMRKHPANKPKPHTRFINMDKMPIDDTQLADFHKCLQHSKEGIVPNGWGEVSFWPSKRIEDGDWTPSVWRSPKLATFACQMASHCQLKRLGYITNIQVRTTGRTLYGAFDRDKRDTIGSFQILASKGADGQQTICSTPDEYWIHKEHITDPNKAKTETDKFLQKAAYLLITEGQDNNTARLTATASSTKYIGGGWMPVIGLTDIEAKAIAVFLNSTPGRVQLMRNAGRTLLFPNYNPAGIANIRIPDIKDDRICKILADCWQQTKDMHVPQFRDGECEVRRLWDEAVASAMEWDADSLSQHRQLLHREPHVSGVGYNFNRHYKGVLTKPS